MSDAAHARLHLKVGAKQESLAALVRWQTDRLAECASAGEPRVLQHVTRLPPKRRDEVLQGGSIYWVIQGRFVARQRIVELTPAQTDARSAFVISYAPELTLVEPRRTQQIKGWRYLAARDAPPDLPTGKDLPDDLRLELAVLGLL